MMRADGKRERHLAMPERTGDRAAALLWECRPGAPIILSSGYSESEVTRRLGSLEIAGFVQQPYTSAALAEKVASVPRNSSQREAVLQAIAVT